MLKVDSVLEPTPNREKTNAMQYCNIVLERGQYYISLRYLPLSLPVVIF